MQETELHDLSDDADYAASQQQGSSSLFRSDNGRRSSASGPESAEVIFSKDNVAIHPSQYASERISGRLKIIKQGPSVFMSWIPYRGQSSNARLSERDRNLYTIKALPFTDVQSIRRHTPTLGWQYIIVVCSSGLAFPPLYFYNGGVKEFLATVKQHLFLIRSAEDANVFIVNDTQDRLQRTLSSLELPGAVPIAKGLSSAISVGESHSTVKEETNEIGGSDDVRISHNETNRRQKQKVPDPARDLSIQVLEKFSLVTRFARETTSQLLGENQIDGFAANKKNHDQTFHHYPNNMASGDVESVHKEVPVASDPLELDKLTLVWGKPRQPSLGYEEWLNFFDSEGRIMDLTALRKRIFYGGVDHGLRKEVWPFLLGYHEYDSTYAEREYLQSVKKSEYEAIKNQWQVFCLLQHSFASIYSVS